eukprot:GGOE01026212.1.p3 GENE.GGOE01026212.1~~GGOE01026212.1.p3  ORF type:complete len:131 (+),score=14.56 GGOE01026212.1:47-439(+)
MGQKLPKETFTWEEVRKHNSAESCWVVAEGLVFDVTSFLHVHPAGAKSILMRAGQDATRDFRFHPTKSRNEIWMKYCIGSLVAEPKNSCPFSFAKPCSNAAEKTLLDAIAASSKTAGLTTAITAVMNVAP